MSLDILSTELMLPLQDIEHSRLSEYSSAKEENGNFSAVIRAVVYSLLFLVSGGLAILVLLSAKSSVTTESTTPMSTADLVTDSESKDARSKLVTRTILSTTWEAATTTEKATTSSTARTRTPVQTTQRRTTPFSPGGIHVAIDFVNSSLDWSYAPCYDFFNFVCSKFEGGASVLLQLEDHTNRALRAMLKNIDVPATGQTPTEKAAALFRACVRLGSNSSYSEVHHLKMFLSSLGLDLSDMSYDPNFDILDRIANLSFEFAIPTFVKISLYRSPPRFPDYILEMRFSEEDEGWLRNRYRQRNATQLVSFYMDYMRDYDSNLALALTTGRIIAAEDIVLRGMDTLRRSSSTAITTTVEKLGTFTQNIISKDHWVGIVTRYTSKTYTAADMVLVYDKAPALAALLMDRTRLARNDSRILIAWTLFRRLLPLTYGKWMSLSAGNGVLASPGQIDDFCYKTISSLMAMAVALQYINTFIPSYVVDSARIVVNDLRDTLLDKLRNTPWIVNPVRDMVLRKANNMVLHIAYPNLYANATFVESFYGEQLEVGRLTFGQKIKNVYELAASSSHALSSYTD